jgi:hypothetical protein
MVIDNFRCQFVPHQFEQPYGTATERAAGVLVAAAGQVDHAARTSAAAR